MRTSCNGCRVLRKGCSDQCAIRPCLQWIKTPDSQAQATLFLAKFYGRTGLLNLINAAPQYLRPAVFKSLLYEACGRIVNPIDGSVGLLWSGGWAKCQAAVEAVLAGLPIAAAADSGSHAPNTKVPLKSAFGDIRHVSKNSSLSHLTNSQKLSRVKTRNRIKRTASGHKALMFGSNAGGLTQFMDPNGIVVSTVEVEVVESMFSVETVEASLAQRAAKPALRFDNQAGSDHGEVGLELTLGLA